MSDLTGCMYAGVGSTGYAGADIFSAKGPYRGLDSRLNAVLTRLQLPARIGRAVIFNRDAITRHGSDDFRCNRAAQEMLRVKHLSACFLQFGQAHGAGTARDRQAAADKFAGRAAVAGYG